MAPPLFIPSFFQKAFSFIDQLIEFEWLWYFSYRMQQWWRHNGNFFILDSGPILACLATCWHHTSFVQFSFYIKLFPRWCQLSWNSVSVWLGCLSLIYIIKINLNSRLNQYCCANKTVNGLTFRPSIVIIDVFLKDEG